MYVLTRKYNIIVALFIAVSIALLAGMVFWGMKQGELQKEIEKTIAYDYDGFATDNADIKDGVIVLAYHRMLNRTPGVKAGQKLSKNPQLQQYNVNSDVFIDQMKWLHDNDINVMTMDEFIADTRDKKIKGKNVVLTFDDIDTTLIRNVLPQLDDLGLPFTAFVITNKTGTNLDGEQLATWEEINELSATSDVNIGLHTNDLHYQVKEKPVISSGKVPLDDMIVDFEESYQKINTEVGVAPNVFAYPYGSKNDKLTNYMHEHGIEATFLLEPNIVTNTQSNNLKEVPRFIVTNSNFEEMKKWLKP